MDYQKFLKTKLIKVEKSGFYQKDLNESLFDYQKKIVEWALEKGKAAVFADCGMGKTLIQLEWAFRVWDREKKPILILTPLAVGQQTKEEGMRFGIDTKIVASQEEVINGINITNYEKIDNFDPEEFIGIVLDESSIIKSFMGKFRNKLINDFEQTKYKLACTATPSPNDFVELGNHSQFLNVMTRSEMLAMFFINDASHGNGWRLKKHAQEEFWKFIGSWAVMIQKPSDLGFSDDNFILPKLNIKEEIIKTNDSKIAEGFNEIRKARKASLEIRCERVREMINDDQWIIWCDYNDESTMLSKIIPDSVEIKGTDKNDKKRQAMVDFANGKIKVLVTKPKIAGFGMNWQNCNNMAFCGVSYSYESFYQATRRCWRYGQKNDVNVYLVLTDNEIRALESIKQKKKNHELMNDKVFLNSNKYINNLTDKMQYKEKTTVEDNFKAILGDSCEKIKDIDENSIDYTIFSPPFSDLYTYSSSERDIGNCRGDNEFFKHFEYLAKDLLRITKEGRLLSFHCMLLPTRKSTDGFIGLKDFRGDLIRIFQKAGFIYHSEVVIWKNPVVAAVRTKALGLLHKQIKKDSAMSRQGIPDYIITMRKPGENKEPIAHTDESFSVDEWQKYASPIWMDINQSDTLQKKSARADKDEKHICPLQLEVIRRCVSLWTNPNDLVFSPFMGIGSEGYQSIKEGRKFLGIELKESYYNQAIENLKNINKELNDPKQTILF